MQNQSKSRKSEGNKNSSNERSEPDTLGLKSIGAVIGENLARDTHERLDRAVDTVNGYVREVKVYVTENPKEAAGIAVAFGAVAWALLYTKPGRRLFDAGAAKFVPEASKWLTSTFSSATSSARVDNH